jgi:LacI family transcriptional regulator
MLTQKADKSTARNDKPTAKDVADVARVSVTTVSRVLSGRDDAISPETRKRVIAAAEKLRYRPSSLAVALRTGRTHTVGLVIPDISDAYFHQIARGLEDAAREAGYSVVLINTDRIAERERKAVEVLYDQNVDAIVFAGGGVDDEKHLVDYQWAHLRVVTVGPHRLPFPSIRVDDAGTIELAASHLFDQGCHRILCLAGQENWLINQARAEGYRRSLAAHSVPYDPALMVSTTFTVDSGHEAVTRVLDAGARFDGLVAFNDYAAVGAMKALAERGIAVPDDVAVIGCDDIQIASLVSPRLSSVSFPQYEFGRAALQRVLDLLAGRAVDEVTSFPYHLEIRESSVRVRPDEGAER